MAVLQCLANPGSCAPPGRSRSGSGEAAGAAGAPRVTRRRAPRDDVDGGPGTLDIRGAAGRTDPALSLGI